MSDGKYSDSEASLHVQSTIGLITGEFCVTLKWSCVTLNWGSTWWITFIRWVDGRCPRDSTRIVSHLLIIKCDRCSLEQRHTDTARYWPGDWWQLWGLRVLLTSKLTKLYLWNNYVHTHTLTFYLMRSVEFLSSQFCDPHNVLNYWSINLFIEISHPEIRNLDLHYITILIDQMLKMSDISRLENSLNLAFDF